MRVEWPGVDNPPLQSLSFLVQKETVKAVDSKQGCVKE